MFTFFQQFLEVQAVMSEKNDGSMKVFPERPEENRENREKFFVGQGMATDRVVSAEIVHKTNVEIISSKNPVNSKDYVTDKPRPLFIGNNSSNREKIISGTDALVTKEKNIFLSVTVADCLPVFFYDPVARIVGIAHSGWRGLIDGVLNKTLETMLNCGAQTKNILVAFGPSIQKCHFEIQSDILLQFARYEKYILKKDGKIFVDLQGIAKNQLRNAGIQETNIETSTLCTFCKKEKFFSYRRDHPKKIQAMAAVIGMK